MKTLQPAKRLAGGLTLPSVTLSSEDESKPDMEDLYRLIDRVIKGEIVLPKFQRDFVWRKKKILDLLDSISRGYPIGSILLWENKNRLLKQASIADLPVGTLEADKSIYYLLDGQQRLSVICGAICWQGNSDPKGMWNIGYDLDSQKFIHLSSLG